MEIYKQEYVYMCIYIHIQDLTGSLRFAVTILVAWRQRGALRPPTPPIGNGEWGGAVPRASRGGGRYVSGRFSEGYRAHNVCVAHEGHIGTCLMEFELHAGGIGFNRNEELTGAYVSWGPGWSWARWICGLSGLSCS